MTSAACISLLLWLFISPFAAHGLSTAAQGVKLECENSCTDLADGKYQSCDSCVGNILCTGGNLQTETCATASVWDDAQKLCVPTSSTCFVQGSIYGNNRQTCFETVNLCTNAHTWHNVKHFNCDHWCRCQGNTGGQCISGANSCTGGKPYSCVCQGLVDLSSAPNDCGNVMDPFGGLF